MLRRERDDLGGPKVTPPRVGTPYAPAVPHRDNHALLVGVDHLIDLNTSSSRSLDELVVGRDPAVGGEDHELEAGAEHLAIR